MSFDERGLTDRWGVGPGREEVEGASEVDDPRAEGGAEIPRAVIRETPSLRLCSLVEVEAMVENEVVRGLSSIAGSNDVSGEKVTSNVEACDISGVFCKSTVI
jgi:hypothetical protein